ncbi:MAG: right-handed parallel beta-helix repeat-containing protein [Verrucomicrobiaceae bacterium]|nr:right-handed parallel beta-helix repeat-containing protein [Verrucomicrobiaceae bacterium]
MQLLRTFVCLVASLSFLHAANVEKPFSSLAELAKAAALSSQKVKLKPGLYRLRDYIPPESIPERRKAQKWQFLTFSGSDNTFDLTGVTIELDTALRQALRSPIHTDEFLITGDRNTVRGLTITSVGNGRAFGGAVLGVSGAGNTLKDCVVHVQGSAPYGYGDLFGKGGFKHSGVHITGSGSRIIGCKVFTKAFGHAFYLQENCDDVLFENCHAEGVMRRTDEILAETSGMAFERKFMSEVMNRSGTKRIQPGYTKALSEDGFRTYHTHRNLVLRNCTAKNMRGGFELRTKTAPKLENCTAIGCERAFWVSTGAVMTKCKGDVQFGPLLYVEGDKAKVDVQLLPTEANKGMVHAIAALYGIDNEVTITAKGRRVHELPILVGFTPPAMGENATAFGERNVRGLILRNLTTMPVVIGVKAEKCQIITRGAVKENLGSEIAVIPQD